MVMLGKREVDGDGVSAGAHLQVHVVAAAQQAKLLGVVGGKQVGPREGGLKAPGAFDEAVGQFVVGARHRGGVHAHERIKRPHRGGRGVAGHKALHGRAQMANLLAVDRL